MKLSKTQERALSKLTDEWQSAYHIGEGLNTLNSLVSKGLAKRECRMGSRFFPANETYFKLKEKNNAMLN